MKDPFFERIHDGEWNACVGVQGDELNYVDGFLEAAVIVADALIEGELTSSRDTLAMPILYNVRHGLELALKFAISSLAQIGMIAERPGEPNHDILGYWTYLSSTRPADHRLRQLITELEPFVLSLDRIDKDGGELRYFENKEGRRSLGNHPVIHLKLVRANVHRLKNVIKEVTDRLEQLEVEWPTGTYTDLLSRTELREIAEMLGPRSKWTEESFRSRRDAVKAKFDIGNVPLTAAITAIEKSRELGPTLGKYTTPIHIQRDRVLLLAEMWLRAHPPGQKKRGIWFPTIKDIKKLLEEGMPKQFELDKTVAEMFSFVEIADAETLFYVGSVPLMGEQYETKLDLTLSEHRANGAAGRGELEKIHHIMSKTNFLVGLNAGLCRIGSPDIAETVQEMIEAADPKDAIVHKAKTT